MTIENANLMNKLNHLDKDIKVLLFANHQKVDACVCNEYKIQQRWQAKFLSKTELSKEIHRKFNMI